ncbi:hypothetical protein CJU89_5271 [Yarrowia sp. B02]|nr:hypothetical protein CJU89_5271 [Yarrowia sp. B02]
MEKINPELFSSFQSALDALEQLSIIQDASAIMKGNLDSVPEDLKLRILEMCDLETCLELSDSCKTYRKLWASLDKTFVCERVLKRVPWFQLNEGSTGLTSWDKCARVLVDRSARCLTESDDIRDRGGTVLIKSLEMAGVGNIFAHQRVDATDVTENELREQMKPIFPDDVIETLRGQSMVGTKLNFYEMVLDVKTMLASRTETPLADVHPAERTARATSPSGLVLRHVDPEEDVAVVDENDNLIHITYSTSKPYMDPEECGEIRAGIDGIIHKASHERDEEGCLVIDPEKLVIKQAKDELCVPLFNLLPGSAGALITRFTSTVNVSPYFGYIEPTADLRHIILCAVPPAVGGYHGYDHFNQKFCVIYNGYLYYLFEGRFVQLWVDFGFQKQLKINSTIRKDIGHESLPQKTDARALVSMNAFFPMLGTFAIPTEVYKLLGIIQDDKNQGMDRFVTLRDACGLVVGDLLTGATYVCKNRKSDRQLVIPYIDNKKRKTVGFYSFSPYHSSRLADLMIRMYNQNIVSEDLNLRYDCMHGTPEEHKEYELNILNPYHPPRSRKDFWAYPRKVKYAFVDEASDFFVEDDELVEPEEEDVDDWDCGTDIGRHYHNAKKSKEHFKKGKRDGDRGRPDTRYNKQEYFMGYHEAYRYKFGYEDPNGIDDYWGSNPKHGKWYLS